MRKINIGHFRPADKSSFLTVQRKHGVALGNGLNVLFTNINEVNSFFAKTNRFLNAKLFTLNEIYIETFTNYQRNWFLFDNSSDMQKNERNIVDNLQIVSKNLLMMIKRSTYENGNQFVFLQFLNSIDSLIQAINILQEINKDRYNYVESNYLNTLKERCLTIKEQISTFGFNLYDHVPLKDMGIKTSL